MRGVAAWALGEIKDLHALPALHERVGREGDALAREMTIRAIGEHERPASVAVLDIVVERPREDPSPHVREVAATIVCSRDRGRRAALANALEDRDAAVRASYGRSPTVAQGRACRQCRSVCLTRSMTRHPTCASRFAACWVALATQPAWSCCWALCAIRTRPCGKWRLGPWTKSTRRGHRSHSVCGPRGLSYLAVAGSGPIRDLLYVGSHLSARRGASAPLSLPFRGIAFMQDLSLRLALVSSAVCCVAFCAPAAGQVRQPGAPASHTNPLPGAVPTIVLPPAPALPSPPAPTGGLQPIGMQRYGSVIDVDIDLAQAGRRDVIPGTQEHVWRVRLHSPGALSLGVTFEEFRVSDGGRVFLYDDSTANVLGAYTTANHKPNGALGVQPVPGDTVVIEYVSSDPDPSRFALRVGEVIHDHLDIFALMKGSLEGSFSGPCLIDVNCAEGAPYQTVKRACLTATSGGGLCSASLLNNTANDGTPFMLIADHCGDMSNGVFIFDFERPGCWTGSAPMAQTVSGATLLAAVALPNDPDSRLYELSVPIPLGYEPFFAGWDRVGLPTGAAATIGNGLGLPRQVAVDASGAASASPFWAVVWDDGIAQPGNSGGPLVRADMRVIGTACCVTNFNCGTQTTFFGQLGIFWNQAGLAQWLDPIGTGAMGIDGYDPLAVGDNYCVSGQSGATISAIGSSSVTANALSLRAMNVGPDEFGIFFYGATQAQTTVGLGTVCVGFPAFRLNPAGQAGTNGLLVRELDITLPPEPAGQITAGSTWNFQGWFRVGQTFDFTNAVEILFTP
ncbi:MAG: HEAT repeat domain-containing protein [bacterium]|nr:HEAT repeat domain-containing protein [bacterium]